MTYNVDGNTNVKRATTIGSISLVAILAVAVFAIPSGHQIMAQTTATNATISNQTTIANTTIPTTTTSSNTTATSTSSALDCNSIATQLGSKISVQNGKVCDVVLVRGTPQITAPDGTVQNKFTLMNTVIEFALSNATTVASTSTASVPSATTPTANTSAITPSGAINSTLTNSTGTASMNTTGMATTANTSGTTSTTRTASPATNTASTTTTGQRVAVVADFALLESEVKPVLQTMIADGFQITGFHNHMIQETPKLMFVHWRTSGNLDTVIADIKQALSHTTILTSQPTTAPTATSTLDCKAIATKLGSSVSVTNGDVCDVVLVRTTPQIVDVNGTALNEFTLMNSVIEFAPATTTTASTATTVTSVPMIPAPSTSLTNSTTTAGELAARNTVANTSSTANTTIANTTASTPSITTTTANTTNQQVMAMGDFALTESEVNPVLDVIVPANWTVTGFHNHMLQETPKLSFMHWTAQGSLDSIISTINAALDKTTIPHGTTVSTATITPSTSSLANATATNSSSTLNTTSATTSSNGKAMISVRAGSDSIVVTGSGFPASSSITTTINGNSATATTTMTTTAGSFSSSLLLSGLTGTLHVKSQAADGTVATADVTVP